MRIQAINADITTLDVDVIVNAANNAMIIGGGVDGAIHKAAGPELINYNALHHGFGCPTGLVKVTPGFNLPAKFIYHTVGPDMRLYKQELGDKLLEQCYGNCMSQLIKDGHKSIAFPLISTGVYNFEPNRAAKIAVETVFLWFFDDVDIDVTFACFGEEMTTMVNKAIEAKDAEIHYADWSVGDTHYKNDDCDEKILDLNTDAPDGTYKVIHPYLGEVGEAYGVVVKDGKFIPEPTLRACAIARNKSGYWGTFLEDLTFFPEDETEAFFECGFGS